MKFWLFMICVTLLIPVIMIAFGRLLMKKVPSRNNFFYGYKTARSSINDETWTFAQKALGKKWWIVGWILLLFAAICMAIVMKSDVYMIERMCLSTIVIQLSICAISMATVEKQLIKEFDNDGNRKN